MSNIKCTVENCKYNEHCDCKAKEIMVCSCGCSNPSHSGETACSTFDRK